MRPKMKNNSQRHEINKPWSRYRHKYAKYNISLRMIMVMSIKQHFKLNS